ncbi:MAG: Ig-like domain-containing protein [Gammaproteobacteria bacterium]
MTALALFAHSHNGSAFDAKLSWDPNPEIEDVRGYKVYFGVESRGCTLDPHDSAFRYQGARALQGASPIFILNEELEDSAAPSYRLLGLPDDTSMYFSATALDSTGNESLFSTQVTLSDELGPKLCDANAPSSTTVRVTYDEFVQEASASNAANYTLTDEDGNDIDVTSVVYDLETFRHVTLNTASTAALSEGRSYNLTVENVQDFFDGNEVDADTQKDFRFTDAPSIRDVNVLELANTLGGPRLEVEFSEPVDKVSAALRDNYDVDNGSVVQNASIAVDINASDHQRNVILELSELTEGQPYTLMIDNVADLDGNAIASGSEISFTVPVDESGPEVSSVHVTNPASNRDMVKVVFNEPIDAASAGETDNYIVMPEVEIEGATLFGDGRTVLLDTAAPEDGDYQMMVDRIFDRAETPNAMTAAALVDFTVIDNLTDSDGDGSPDSRDNCTLVSNEDQRDTDDDGFGNLCDGDLDNDGETETVDLRIFRRAFRTEVGDADYTVHADYNDDGEIGTADLRAFRRLFRRPPGPSCCGDVPGQ